MWLNKSLPALEVTVYHLHLVIMNCRTTKLKIAPKVLQEYTVNIDFVMLVRWKKESGKSSLLEKEQKRREERGCFQNVMIAVIVFMILSQLKLFESMKANCNFTYMPVWPP